MMSRRSLFLLGLIGLAFVAPALAQQLDGADPADDTAALASFPYCVCSDYKCRASPYRLYYKGTFPDPKNKALARLCYTVRMVSLLPGLLNSAYGNCICCWGILTAEAGSQQGVPWNFAFESEAPGLSAAATARNVSVRFGPVVCPLEPSAVQHHQSGTSEPLPR